MSAATLEPLEFDDELLTEAQAAKLGGMALSTFRELVKEGQGPWTLWREDVRRWAKAQRAGEPNMRQRRRR